MSRELPILMSAPMVRALLSGAKTQTRRVVKPQPPPGAQRVIRPFADERLQWAATDPHDMEQGQLVLGEVPRCPYGVPGDRLWVKESTIKVEEHGWIGPVYVESDAGRDALEWGYGESDDPDHIPPHAIKRRPSIFMTRAMSRITLEITGVRVERLQDISEADATAEGIGRYDNGTFGLDDPSACMGPSAVVAYMRLWNHINGPGSWDANPWVWVLEFRKLERQ